MTIAASTERLHMLHLRHTSDSRSPPPRAAQCQLHRSAARAWLLLMLPMMACASPDLQGAMHHHQSEPSGGGDAALQSIAALAKLRAAEWEMRMQPVQELFAAYTARHRACGDSSSPGQYVLVRMGDLGIGLGNRIPSLITGFLLALIMERCFFIDAYPLFFTAFQHELDFRWAPHRERLLALGHDPDAVWRIPASGHEMFAAWTARDLLHFGPSPHGVLLEDDRDYTAALLQSNPHLQRWIGAHFPSREFFAPLAAFLLRLAPGSEQRVRAFQDAHPAAFMVGLQIRRRKCDKRAENEIFCELRPSVESYCNVARAIQAAHGLQDEDVLFFLAADEEEIYTQVEGIMGKERVVYTDNGISPGSTLVAENPTENPGTEESALLDMALLSRCDDLVMTMASSFGYIAAAWGGLAPVHMLFGRHQTAHNPWFYRALSSEPCFWHAKNLMRDVGEKGLQELQSNPLWMQYAQCHNHLPDLDGTLTPVSGQA